MIYQLHHDVAKLSNLGSVSYDGLPLHPHII